MAGESKDQKLAAIITPPVKPKEVSKIFRLVLLKNTTNAAPDAVKPQVNSPAYNAWNTGCCSINQVYKSVIFD